MITGADGFVGGHLRRELGECAVAAEANVLDADALARELRAARPDAVVHLAALSSVAASWEDVADVWHVNVVGTVNVLEAVRAEQPGARALVVSTGEVYGRADAIPTPEDSPVAPLSPYAASKAAAEVACARAARADGLDIVVARSFAHIGPGQADSFAIGSWTRQIAALKAEGGGVLRVGELSVRRDLTDVRDVCRAYRLLLDRDVPSGTYNVASGRAVELRAVVDTLISLAGCAIEVEVDPARLRPADIPVLAGDPARLVAASGWSPAVPLEQTLADALEYAERTQLEERIAIR